VTAGTFEQETVSRAKFSQKSGAPADDTIKEMKRSFLHARNGERPPKQWIVSAGKTQ